MSGAMLKDVSKKLLYTSGLLGLYHRLRNADSLTVVMFHRTLSPDDPRWATCDPDYTLATRWLEQSLAFFRRHYSVVSLEQVLAICREHLLDDDEAGLFVTISHRLGHLIYYEHDPALRDVVVLKPGWSGTGDP